MMPAKTLCCNFALAPVALGSVGRGRPAGGRRTDHEIHLTAIGLALYLNGDVMIPTEERPKSIPSALVDLKDLPLAKMPELNADILGEAIKRILPESSAVPVAAFNSAI
jgi:FXSXX-COOH protein